MAISKSEFFEDLKQPLSEKVITYKGKDYRIREMSESEAVEYELALADKNGKFDFKKARRAMIACMLIDDNGNKIVEDPEQLCGMKRSLAGALYQACLELNNYDDKEVEDLVKNSEPVES